MLRNLALAAKAACNRKDQESLVPMELQLRTLGEIALKHIIILSRFSGFRCPGFREFPLACSRLLDYFGLGIIFTATTFPDVLSVMNTNKYPLP